MGPLVWGPRSNTIGWSRYLGKADPAQAVPGRRQDLHGPPPAWLGVGSRDLLYEQDVRYHHALRAAGTPSRLVVVDGAFHGFDIVAQHADVSRQFHDAFISAVRTAVAPGDGTRLLGEQ
ncbi:alpha/beta hydrolase fold domain-containing protein [Nocardia miyunensis]|uniref:alpha/beta hydrolase fold domain-containing protein n=1 Tax=Nocardia miyunensis TaxID=282684 RepID=UPI00082A4AB4|nr:alpha/beta hydrolase fold domain-containing protein [Nocardia miyunensis]